MAAKNLHQDLGLRYIRDMYVGAVFQLEDHAYRLMHCEGNSLECDALDLNDNEASWVRRSVPLSVLKSFSTFKYPALGYRNIPDATRPGMHVMHVTSRRSAVRGLREDSLVINGLPVFDNLLAHQIVPLIHTTTRQARIRSIFKPEFLKWRQGLSRLLDGELSGFALNENVAVGIACSSGTDAAFEIYFKERVVGTVDERGNVTLRNKIVQRDSNKLFGS